MLIKVEVNHHIHFASMGGMISSKLVLAEIHSIKQLGDRLMTTLSDISTAISAIQESASAEKAEVLAVIQGLAAQVTALQTELVNGTVVSATDLTTILVQLQGLDATVKGIVDPAPVAEVPVATTNEPIDPALGQPAV